MKIALMGCGTVGRGVYEICGEMAEKLGASCGAPSVELKYILDIRQFDDPGINAVLVRDISVILNDPEVSVVVEAMGGTHPAYEFCMQCLEHGKSVVTSNKQLVAEKAEDLFAAAKAHGAQFRFGASVCGGIPVLRTMFYSLAANEITGFAGILNGTTNFILTKMIREKMSFDGALRLAQQYGYAEADPTDDIEGKDACRKTAILASIAFGTHVYPDAIHTEGITGITAEDVAYVNDCGGSIKLLGIGEKRADGKIYAIVCPAVVRSDGVLAGVQDEFNAISLFGTKVGHIMLYGPGAGKAATASAVMADVLDCLRHDGFDPVYSWENASGDRLAPYDSHVLRLYVRGIAAERSSAVAAIRESFEDVRFLSRENAPENEIAFVTGAAEEKELRRCLAELRGFTTAFSIRMTEF